MRALIAIGGIPINMQPWYDTDPPSSGSILSLLEGGGITTGVPSSGRISYWTWAN